LDILKVEIGPRDKQLQWVLLPAPAWGGGAAGLIAAMKSTL
jgi:hypothetical protein